MNRALPMGSGPRPINNGLDLQTRDTQRRAMEIAMKTQLLEIASPIYSEMINRPGHRPGAAEMRQMAGLAWRSALYLAEAAGLLQINDDELWGTKDDLHAVKDELQLEAEPASRGEPRSPSERDISRRPEVRESLI